MSRAEAYRERAAARRPTGREYVALAIGFTSGVWIGAGSGNPFAADISLTAKIIKALTLLVGIPIACLAGRWVTDHYDAWAYRYLQRKDEQDRGEASR